MCDEPRMTYDPIDVMNEWGAERPPRPTGMAFGSGKFILDACNSEKGVHLRPVVLRFRTEGRCYSDNRVEYTDVADLKCYACGERFTERMLSS